MRPELTTLEKIDLFLSDKMTATDKVVFEKEIANNSELANAVSKQKELIKVVNRQALRAQINNVAAASAAGGSGGLSNFMLGTIGVGVVLVATVSAYIYFGNNDDKNEIANTVLIENQENTTENTIVESEEYQPEDGLILEEPETIFSSTQKYSDLDELEDNMNVTVNFRPYERTKPITDEGTVTTDLITEGEEVANNQTDNLIEQPPKPEVKNLTARAFYPGGNVAMKKFIDKNLRYPKTGRDKGIECVVRCDFHVTAEGRITEIAAKCLKMSEGDGEVFNDVRILMNKKLVNSFIGNATHILRTMPIWEPARNSNGNPVVSAQRMYFNYDLKRGCLVYQLDDEVQIISESPSSDEESE